MKIYRVLLGAVFTFLAMECQAATKSSLTTTDIFADAIAGYLGTSVGSTPANVKVEGFRNVQDFDIATTRLLSKDQKKSFVKHLFTSDDQNTFFTYALLVMAANGDYESGKYETQSRAATILRAIQANTDMNNAFTSNPNKVIILNRLQSNLGVGLQRRASFVGSPSKAPAAVALRFSADDISVIENRLGIVKPAIADDGKLPSSVNAKRGSSSTVPLEDGDLDDHSRTPSKETVVDLTDKGAEIAR